MGEGPKKEYRYLDGITVISRALLSFAESGLVSTAMVTHPEGGEEEARAAMCPELLSTSGFSIRFCQGGDTRRASVYLGLQALGEFSPDIVLIHDGARPRLSPVLVRSVAEAARINEAAVPLIPTVDTMKEIDHEGFLKRQLRRSRVMAVQTPQGFSYAKILSAHMMASARIAAGETSDDFTDDAEIWALAKMGPIAWVPGEETNRKITFPEDLS
jgi:2-C-methyl-D-erythritol 4-phosphate cytidylyltransferase